MQIPSTYDTLFLVNAPAIPLNLCKAVAWKESRMNPKSAKGAYWGLMQVGVKGKRGKPAMYEKFNSEMLASAPAGKFKPYTKQDMLKPAPNIQVWAWYMSSTVIPEIVNAGISLDWSDANFVRFVVTAWNSGPYGTAKGIRYLRRKGIPVLAVNLFKHGKAAGLPWTLQEHGWNAAHTVRGGDKRQWQHGVTKLYGDLNRGTVTSPPAKPTTAKKKDWGWLIALLLLASSRS